MRAATKTTTYQSSFAKPNQLKRIANLRSSRAAEFLQNCENSREALARNSLKL